MDFDEYEYLENTVENPDKKRLQTKVNGDDKRVEHEDKGMIRSRKHRNDDYDEFDPPSKHSRSVKEEDSNHSKNKSSHRGSSSRDRDIEKEKSSRDLRHRDKDEGSGKDRSRNKDHDRDNEREREKEKNRNHGRREHERAYGREADKEREQERSRIKSNSERQPSDWEKETSRDIERSADKNHRERHDRDFRDRVRDNRKYKERKEELQAEADPERDQRTVFAYQIALKASERDVYEFFSKAGKVRDVQIIMDRNSRRPKGFGYIEFYDAMSVPMAIALSGHLLLGQPVMVKPSEAEKNLVQSTSAAAGGGGPLGPYAGGARRLYVGNLPVTIKEEQLRQVFEPFGAVELVQMPTDPVNGNCKGYAFIQFARLEDAQAAQNLNGQLEIGGRTIKVSAVTDQVGVQTVGENITDLDDDDGSGLSLNAESRALLMRKLDRTGSSSSPGLSLPSIPVLGQPAVPLPFGLPGSGLPIPAITGSSIDTIGVPSECLLLKNMFDPNSEIELDFNLDVEEDVREECSKFGKLKHVYVDKNSAGFVYLRFENTESSIAAQRALHGRWFAGKMITATFMPIHDYHTKFLDSS